MNWIVIKRVSVNSFEYCSPKYGPNYERTSSESECVFYSIASPRAVRVSGRKKKIIIQLHVVMFM